MSKINFRFTTRGIAIYGVYTALFLLMTFIPQVGYIRVGIISATLMAVPVVIISIHKGIPGLIYGLFMWALSAVISEAYTPDATLGIIHWDGIFLTMVLGRFLIAIPVIPFMILSKKLNVKLVKNKRILARVENPVVLEKTLIAVRALLIGLLISVSNTLIVVGLLMVYPAVGIKEFGAFLVTLSINWIIEWIVPPFIACLTAGMSDYLASKDKNERKQRY